jgi:murein L,D-transpeptidase YcbB/YkuD
MTEDVAAPVSVSGSTDITTSIPDTTPVADPNDFRNLLSDEYKNHNSLQEYKDINGLVKSHIELSKMMGNSIRVPGDDATEEQVNKFYSKLGRPDEADKYELSTPDKLPDGFQINDDGVKEFKELAHKLGLSNKQADSLRQHYLNQAMQAHESSYVSEEQQEAQFKEKGLEMFGDKFEQVIANTSKILAENVPENQKALIEKLDNDSLLAVTQVLNNVQSKYLKPDSVPVNYTQASTAEDKRNELKAMVDKMKTMDKFHPEFKSLDEKINSYYSSGVKIYD